MEHRKIKAEELGGRLHLARKRARMTEAEAAAKLGMARTALLAMEKGERPVRSEELFKLVGLYDISACALLRPDAVHVDLSPQFFTPGEEADEAEAARILADMVQTEADLENFLGVKRQRNYPPEKSILPGDVRTQAENDAGDLRDWLGIGQTPVRDILDLLDFDLDIRVYVRKFDPKIRGLFAFDDAVGACMLLNAAHSREQRAETAGHELGHFVATRCEAEVLRAKGGKNSREERYADAFGRAFLMPADMVARRFQKITAGAARSDYLHVDILSRIFGVTQETMALRLDELGLIDADRLLPPLKNNETLADSVGPDASQPMPPRLCLLAAEARRRELMTEGQLSNMLRLDRISVREMVGNALIDDRVNEEPHPSG